MTLERAIAEKLAEDLTGAIDRVLVRNFGENPEATEYRESAQASMTELFHDRLLAYRAEVLEEAIKKLCPDCRRGKRIEDGSHPTKDLQGNTYFVGCVAAAIRALKERKA